jgi:hypothetical protein
MKAIGRNCPNLKRFYYEVWASENTKIHSKVIRNSILKKMANLEEFGISYKPFGEKLLQYLAKYGKQLKVGIMQKALNSQF